MADALLADMSRDFWEEVSAANLGNIISLMKGSHTPANPMTKDEAITNTYIALHHSRKQDAA